MPSPPCPSTTTGTEGNSGNGGSGPFKENQSALPAAAATPSGMAIQQQLQRQLQQQESAAAAGKCSGGCDDGCAAVPDFPFARGDRDAITGGAKRKLDYFVVTPLSREEAAAAAAGRDGGDDNDDCDGIEVDLSDGELGARGKGRCGGRSSRSSRRRRRVLLAASVLAGIIVVVAVVVVGVATSHVGVAARPSSAVGSGSKNGGDDDKRAASPYESVPPETGEAEVDFAGPESFDGEEAGGQAAKADGGGDAKIQSVTGTAENGGSNSNSNGNGNSNNSDGNSGNTSGGEKTNTNVFGQALARPINNSLQQRAQPPTASPSSDSPSSSAPSDAPPSAPSDAPTTVPPPPPPTTTAVAFEASGSEPPTTASSGSEDIMHRQNPPPQENDVSSSVGVTMQQQGQQQQQQQQQGTMLCNGHSNLCNVPANKALFATIHNAQSTSEDGVPFLAAASNHRYQLEKAVEAGFRGINLDVGLCDGNRLALVHGPCWLGYRDFNEVFSWLDGFLAENPNEVIIMPTEINNDAGGRVTLSQLYSAMSLSGNDFTRRLYVHSDENDSWPTLRQLIEADRRVLFFHYNGDEDCGADGGGGSCPPGLHPWFDYAVESRFSFQSLSEIAEDAENGCQITRGWQGRRDFYGLNLFVTDPFPDSDAAATLNSAGFLRRRVRQCGRMYEGYVRSDGVGLLLVDFWSVGDVVDTVSLLNERFFTAEGDRLADDEYDDNDPDFVRRFLRKGTT